MKPKDIKVLIVDDHVQTVISISQILEYYGFKTLSAYNPKDAIEIANKENPNLLLLNIHLEYDDEGFNIAKSLPNYKILFFTGEDIDSSKLKKFKNVIGFLKKPIINSELLKILKKEFDVDLIIRAYRKIK
jgi:DNA-binding response OmpR family regulator